MWFDSTKDKRKSLPQIKVGQNGNWLNAYRKVVYAKHYRRKTLRPDAYLGANGNNRQSLDIGVFFNHLDTPQSIARYEPRKDTNENLKDNLNLSNASSQVSIDEPICRVEGWARSFERLLSDAVGVRCFQEFLKKEFSEENVLFWVSCERFKLLKDLDKMRLNAIEIFRNYLSSKAPFLVNVDQTAVKRAEENLDTPNSDMFTVPQDQVFQLMKFDSYHRFLKSDLYQECLQAENYDRLFPYEEEIDEELRKKPAWVKKSKSSLNEHDKKRNLLNFLGKAGKAPKSPEPTKLRKERSSSMSAMEEYNRKNALLSPSVNGHGPKDTQLWDGLHTDSKSAFVRVILPDGTSTMVVAENGHSIKQSLQEVCELKKIVLQTYDVTVGFEKQMAQLDADVSTLSDNVIFLERRVLFRFDLPNGRSVGIKANPSKTLRDVLHPVMKRNGFNIDSYTVHVMNYKVSISLDVAISSVENKRIVTKLAHKKLEKQNSDSVIGKAQDIRSSFRRFRTSSFKDDRSRSRRSSLDRAEKELLTGRKIDEMKAEETLARKISNEMKHLILGRTRSADDDGASALMSVLQKSQSGRLDDQRGMISRDLELPDFLKVTPSVTPSSVRSTAVSTYVPHSTSTQSSPSRSPFHYPATPVIVDRDRDVLKRSEESLEKQGLSLSLNSSLNSARQASLCSVHSWKELSSPDRDLIDKSFLSANSINAPVSPDHNKSTLLELSRSDPALVKKRLKQPICKENSAPPFTNFENTEIDIDIDLLHANCMSTPQHETSSETLKVSERNRSRSLRVTSENTSNHVTRSHTLSSRPQPINMFNESEILRGLEVAGYDVIPSDPEETLVARDIDCLSPETPSGSISPNFSPPLVHNSVSLSKSLNYNSGTAKKAKDNDLVLDVRKSRSAERLGSVDILEYDLSPRSSEAHRMQHLFDRNPLSEKFNDKSSSAQKAKNKLLDEVVFTANAIPTPEKGRLLDGETIRGRQNEKITFV